jgi:peptidoglycan/LPS O-acetylase OafA/YrhL
MGTAILVSGLAILIGGVGWGSVAVSMRRRGKPWVGLGVGAGAALLYSGVVLSGANSPATTIGTLLVWVVAVLMWVGAFISFRELRKRDARRHL